MRKKITIRLKNEILLTLKNESFEVSNESQLCEIFDINIRFFELFKRSKNIKIDRQCKIELLQWIKQGYLETNNSLFGKTITPPTFLDVMKAASVLNDDD
ncbi:hypothetical protein [Aestuariivivens sediminicola]|uniref:hypothetical protein n=1 Tax=Aestuariivivens sediminicola TaxID=2913560 RepID=UPI001F580752|nr:hypothetical protein [Aestuariivivens sediminicola]